MFVCHGIYFKICYGICPDICLAFNKYKKFMVSQNLRLAHLLEVGLTKIPRDHETLSVVRHVGLHVDFSSMKSWAFRPSPSCVK